jgi:hypothetical protein
MQDGLMKRHFSFQILSEYTDQDHAILNTYPEQGDKPDAGADTEIDNNKDYKTHDLEVKKNKFHYLFFLFFLLFYKALVSNQILFKLLYKVQIAKR